MIHNSGPEWPRKTNGDFKIFVAFENRSYIPPVWMIQQQKGHVWALTQGRWVRVEQYRGQYIDVTACPTMSYLLSDHLEALKEEIQIREGRYKRSS